MLERFAERLDKLDHDLRRQLTVKTGKRDKLRLDQPVVLRQTSCAVRRSPGTSKTFSIGTLNMETSRIRTCSPASPDRVEASFNGAVANTTDLATGYCSFDRRGIKRLI